ncbi:hypothetical protein [Noviherbaspirillum saxi]|uniref:Uncharacterized protein n=1 Tax=Noviherbaspirillum saxi TaxID=2320863 RepID=A0A3A3FS74_9BURK|nr:hypothetical protein [Noviherbaspirillum saxi]RJF99067.1 hypothetical protein D3871_11485 [Noviherbaspirillum saxi]
MNDKKASVAITDEREAFEKWVVSRCSPLVRKEEVLRRCADDSYVMFSVGENWATWQARAALSCASQADKPVAWRNDLLDEVRSVVMSVLPLNYGRPRSLSKVRDEILSAINSLKAAAPVAQSQQSEIAAQQAVTLPEAVIAWHTAEKARIDAVNAYNERVLFVREHCPFGTSVDPEYQLMEDARRNAMALLKPMFEAISAAPSQQEKEAALPAPRKTYEQQLAELPTLPVTHYNGYADGSEPLYTAEQMHDYALAAIEAAPLPLQEPKPVAPNKLQAFVDYFAQRNVEATGEWRSAVEDVQHHLDDLIAAQALLDAKDAKDAELKEIRAVLNDTYVEYHSNGMACGLEDRGITDRYDAMRFGWDEAVDRMHMEVIKPAIDAIDAAIAATQKEQP